MARAKCQRKPAAGENATAYTAFGPSTAVSSEKLAGSSSVEYRGADAPLTNAARAKRARRALVPAAPPTRHRDTLSQTAAPLPDAGWAARASVSDVRS